MNPDVTMVIGIVLAVLSVPAMLGSFVERLIPWGAMVTAAIAAGLILWTVMTNPGVYTFKELPLVFIRVAALVI